MRIVAFFLSLWATLVVSSMSVVLAQEPADLQEYLARIRDTGMSEWARGDLSVVAGILLGQTILDFRKDDSTGRLWPGYMSAICPNPNTDASEEAQRHRRLGAEREALVRQLKPFADTDSSGFVSTREGAVFRDLIEFGYLATYAAQMDGATVQAIARASALSEGDVTERLSAYREMAARMAAASIKPIPAVPVR